MFFKYNKQMKHLMTMLVPSTRVYTLLRVDVICL